jgi:D-alanyl-D-alanine carboxypeptidase (penicillin-binding protein 5/6)
LLLALVTLLVGPIPGLAAESRTEPPYVATVLMEAETGTVLAESDAHRRWPPASMVKMMLILLTAERVSSGRAAWEDPVRVSAWASKMGGSQVYLREGEIFPLREMTQAVAIASANDAAAAIAEHLAGTGPAFVDLMNQRAREMGLADTTYRSVHGLPPGKGQEPDITSAHDLAQLARAVLTHREVIGWSSMPEAPFREGKFRLSNTNHLVRWYKGITGLKTGFYYQAGFGVTATATRGDLSLIAVVLGARTKRNSLGEAARLLDSGFSTYRIVRATEKGRRVGPPIAVSGGEAAEVQGVASAELRLVLKQAEARQPQVELRVPKLLEAPVRKGQRIGEVVVISDGRSLGRTDLLADRDIAATGWVARWRTWWEETSAASE